MALPPAGLSPLDGLAHAGPWVDGLPSWRVAGDKSEVRHSRSPTGSRARESRGGVLWLLKRDFNRGSDHPSVPALNFSASGTS